MWLYVRKHKNTAGQSESYNERELAIERQDDRDKAHWSVAYNI